MELVLRGEVDLAQAEVWEEEQAEERAEWGERDPVQDLRENAYVPAVELLLLIKRDFPATSGTVPSAVR
jgi:hypothetical protein